ncbi:hypothetical protein [Sandarakinorhabdus limnophila]|uniref:hypothetical protein n=1 Tax=Sandarakinorhabdus limnophila TaxID=210512 RepID=UPI0023536452|nr:hypothetical protein [Sandarakinorhabdus limnophila]
MGWASKRAVLAGSAGVIACGLLLAAPVVGQDAGPNRDAPKSLLPPGFDTPAPAPSAAPAPLLPGAAAPPAEAATAEQAPLLTGQPGDVTPPAFVETQTAAALPPGAPIGIIDAAGGAFAADAFIGSNGRFLAGLANRIAGPVASRWVAITLGRALASRVPGPAGIGDGDWVAARAGLLVRMGAVDLARRLIDVLPQERYTPATYRVAGEVSLAAADLAGLCPIAATGRALSDDVMWDLAWGMCAAMDGDDITAAGVIDTVRNRRGALPAFDLRLAQRVVVLAGGAGRADGINWAEEEGLTPYRYGVASAAGVTVPADRLAALGPAHAGWAVRNAALPAATRFALLRQAAVLGTLSADELASAVAALAPADASGGFAADSRAGRLRDAFTGSPQDRAEAIAAIAGDDDYGGLLEAATAAAALKPAAALAGQSDVIIAALLAAGNTRAARAWWPVAQDADDDVRARAQALLAAGAGVAMDSGDVRAWRDAAKASPRREAMLAAALSGLGQARGLDRDGFKAISNRWTAALASAARRRAAGEVALLAATGLQGGWADVPPAHVEAIVAALMACGRVTEARLLAAEAITRSA